MQLILADAQNLANEAEQAWVKGDYDTANKCIREAYDLLYRIQPPPTVINWWLICGIIVGVVVIALLTSLLVSRRTI